MSVHKQGTKNFKKIISKIAEIIIVSLGVFWAAMQVFSTVAYDFSIELFYKLSGVPKEVFIAEEYVEGNDFANQFFSDAFFAFLIVFSFFIAIIGAIVLTKRRSPFTALGLLLSFILPKEREEWGTIKDKSTGRPVAFAIVRLIRTQGEKSEIVEESVADLDGKYRLKISELSNNLKLEVSAEGYTTTSESLDYAPLVSGYHNIIQDAILVRFEEKKNKFNLTYFRPIIYKYLIWLIYILSIILFLAFAFYLYSYPGSWWAMITVGLYGFAVVWNTFIMFKRVRTKNGRVLNIETKKPLAGVFVNLYDPEKKKEVAVEISKKDGSVRFHIPAGEYLIKAAKTGYEMEHKVDRDLFRKVRVNNAGFLLSNIYLNQASAGSQDESSISNPFAE